MSSDFFVTYLPDRSHNEPGGCLAGGIAMFGTAPQRGIIEPTPELIAAARHVAVADASRYEAPSAYHAACWLLALRITIALVALISTCRYRALSRQKSFLASEDNTLASIHCSRLFAGSEKPKGTSIKMPGSGFAQPFRAFAIDAFDIASRCMEAAAIGSVSTKRRPSLSTTGLAPTWSWDPLVALVFAIRGISEGESGIVLIRAIDPSRDTELILAPSIAKRSGPTGILSGTGVSD
jgi:hypothetical protein